MSVRLAIVVPCYNEQEVLPETARRLGVLLDRLSQAGKVRSDSLIYLVDDGSKDATWSLIEQLSAQSDQFAGIKLSRNRGHQNALLAGLFTAEGDVLVSIDADLQDDVDAIESMIDEFHNGAEVVYAVRRHRTTDTFFKRATAVGFYRFMASMGVETIHNHADFRLMSRRAVEALKAFPETNLFLRGMVPLIGYRSAMVHFDRAARLAGESKYPLRKMLALALDAITSFSVVPLRIITLIGFTVFAGAVGVSMWILWLKLFTTQAIPGWASIALPQVFLGGVQILCLGVIGEYLGKIYVETKGRPRYIVEKVVHDTSAQARSPSGRNRSDVVADGAGCGAVHDKHAEAVECTGGL